LPKDKKRVYDKVGVSVPYVGDGVVLNKFKDDRTSFPVGLTPPPAAAEPAAPSRSMLRAGTRALVRGWRALPLDIAVPSKGERNRKRRTCSGSQQPQRLKKIFPKQSKILNGLTSVVFTGTSPVSRVIFADGD
jgi:hypothetical protein